MIVSYDMLLWYFCVYGILKCLKLCLLSFKLSPWVGWIHVFMLVLPNSDRLLPQLEGTVGSSAHLLQSYICCAIWDVLLHTLVGASCYLSYHCPPISLKQCGHFPLTSGFNKAFSPRELLQTAYFLFSWPFSVNPRHGCAGKPYQISSFSKYSDKPIWHQQPCHIQSHLNHSNSFKCENSFTQKLRA